MQPEIRKESTPRDFTHFIEAQQEVYATALAEIRSGRKRTHWMWFIFPQLRRLGYSEMSHKYGIADLEEAKAYLENPLLSSRLKQITEALLTHSKKDAVEIFGDIDAVKLRSCMTLFAHAEEDPDSIFRKVLQQYFHGIEDDKTTAILALQSFDFTK